MDLRVTVHLDSENLCLPELRPLIGKDVEITVREKGKRARRRARKRPVFKVKSKAQIAKELDAIAKAQGVKPIRDPRELLGGWPESELNDGFEVELKKWRKREIVPELEGDL